MTSIIVVLFIERTLNPQTYYEKKNVCLFPPSSQMQASKSSFFLQTREQKDSSDSLSDQSPNYIKQICCTMYVEGLFHPTISNFQMQNLTKLTIQLYKRLNSSIRHSQSQPQTNFICAMLPKKQEFNMLKYYVYHYQIHANRFRSQYERQRTWKIKQMLFRCEKRSY